MRRLLVIPLVLLIAATVAVRYVADDMSELVTLRTASPIGLMVIRWQLWTGRWAYSLVAGTLHQVDFPGLPALVALALSSGAAWKLGRWLGLAALLTGLCATTNLIQSVYWGAGAMVYALPLGLFGWTCYAIFRTGVSDSGL